jgi:hypothetical protein
MGRIPVAPPRFVESTRPVGRDVLIAPFGFVEPSVQRFALFALS